MNSKNVIVILSRCHRNRFLRDKDVWRIKDKYV